MIALKAGWRAAARNPSLVLMHYGLGVVLATPVAVGFALLAHQYAGKSMAAEALATFEPFAIGAMVSASAASLKLLVVIAMTLLLLGGVALCFLNGPTYSAGVRGARLGVRETFALGGKTLWRLVRLELLALPFTVIVVGPVGFLTFKLAKRIAKDATWSGPQIGGRVIALCATLLVFMLVNAACDQMRAEAVAMDESRARFAFWRGLVRTLRRPVQVLAVYLPYVLLAFALSAAVLLVDVGVSRAGTIGIVGGVLLQQITALARAFARVARAGAETSYVLRLSPSSSSPSPQPDPPRSTPAPA